MGICPSHPDESKRDETFLDSQPMIIAGKTQNKKTGETKK